MHTPDDGLSKQQGIWLLLLPSLVGLILCVVAATFFSANQLIQISLALSPLLFSSVAHFCQPYYPAWLQPFNFLQNIGDPFTQKRLEQAATCLYCGTALYFFFLALVVSGVEEFGSAFQPPAAPPPPSTNTILSASDLQFGRQQVDQMLRDRKEMAISVGPGDPVYQWTARQFAGEATGQHIYWSSAPPSCPLNCRATDAYASGNQAGFIRIRERHAEGDKNREVLICEDLWSWAVFELYNIANGDEHRANDDAALTGKISRQKWVENLTRSEFQVIPKTQRFYLGLWKPWAESKGLSTHPYYWQMTARDSYEEWMKQFKDPSAYPYNYYRNYDKYIAPYIRR